MNILHGTSPVAASVQANVSFPHPPGFLTFLGDIEMNILKWSVIACHLTDFECFQYRNFQTSFQVKTAQSKANVRTNKMTSTKWAYHK